MVLRDRRAHELKPGRCTIADGQLSIYAALAKQRPSTADHFCWNHRIIPPLEAILIRHQAQARTLLSAIQYAERQAACEAFRTHFMQCYRQPTLKKVDGLK